MSLDIYIICKSLIGMSSDCKPDMIEEVRKRFEMLIPEQRAILYSKIPDKRITNYLEEALQKKKNVSTAFKKLCDHKYIRLVDMYDILDDILFKEGVKVVAKLFYKLNQRQRRKLYDTLDYKEDIQTPLNESTYVNQNKSDKNCFKTILHLSDSGAIELEELYNYLTNPPNSPIKIPPNGKRRRNNSTNSPVVSRKLRKIHPPSPEVYSPVRTIPEEEFGEIEPGDRTDKKQEEAAMKTFVFSPGKKQTKRTIPNYFKPIKSATKSTRKNKGKFKGKF